MSYFIEMLHSGMSSGLSVHFFFCCRYYFIYFWAKQIYYIIALWLRAQSLKCYIVSGQNSSGLLSNLVRDISSMIIAFGFVPSFEPPGLHVGTVKWNDEETTQSSTHSGHRITFANELQPTSWKILIVRASCYDPVSATLYPHTPCVHAPRSGWRHRGLSARFSRFPAT